MAHTVNLPTAAAPAREVAGPRGNWLAGSISDVQRDRLAFSVGLAEQYGDVVKFHMGPMTFYMVYHPDGVKRILQDNHHNYGKETPVFAMLRPLLGNGLLLSEGEFWLRQRRLMQPMFHRQRIAGFGEVMTAAAERTLAGWRESTGGSRPVGESRPVDIASEMMRLTLDVACRSLFSMDILGEAAKISAAVAVVLEDFTFRFDHPIYPPLGAPTQRNRRYLAAVRALDEIVYGMITQRRQQVEHPNDLLSLLLEARDEETGEGMTDKQIRDELITLLLAGHETTAVTLIWALYLLSLHPDIRAKLLLELDQVLDGRLPTVDDLPRLVYTQMVIDETMRLYPPAWITNRVALADDEVCGYHIPKGATVAVCPYVTHRLPQFWENPEGFDPERFTPERSAQRHRFAYFPFGAGPRMCIGRGFALTEAPLVLATIMQRCRLDLMPGREVRKRPLITLRPDGAVPMMVSWR